MVVHANNTSRRARTREPARRGYTLEGIAPLLVSVVFILAACFLIVFAPPDQAKAIVIVAIGLMVVGVGLAGFGVLTLRLPGLDLGLHRDEPTTTPEPASPRTTQGEHDK